MQLATLPNSTRDGALAVVSRDHCRAVLASEIATTLQDALERWSEVEPQLRCLAAALEAGTATGSFAFEAGKALAPLPRAWQWLDGSAYESHGDLMQQVLDIEPIPRGTPLMYQGVSSHFYNSTDDIPFLSEEKGIDFEGEFGVIVDAVPMGITPQAALKHIRLVMQINDWSLRALAGPEMKTGFGWVQAKPPCSVAPVAVTPDALGRHWRDGRVDLPLHVTWNDALFGLVQGYPMGFGFHELVAHAAATRDLVAGTIIGSGTVSNANFKEVGSTCIAERRGIEVIDHGAPKTDFMKFGDRVRMESRFPDGSPLFGAINQKIVRKEAFE
ncbi:fumarylacetoacetate hydrolase family protein [Aquisediminimonas profunda]|uniref:fumarylacetoacetate hydrolase family protein n=1 Tax=Aquisediminimonas profunda TaxID=1550733 RepID=UPI001C634A0F|nr:fumarylacetoacetate hydrolase family protein [Aquisediminimonas profunda]